MQAARKSNRCRIVVQSPADRNQSFSLPFAVAWAAARGIARDTHHAVILYGRYGGAKFSGDGSGYVEWNERSRIPGIVSYFDSRGVAFIH